MSGPSAEEYREYACALHETLRGYHAFRVSCRRFYPKKAESAWRGEALVRELLSEVPVPDWHTNPAVEVIKDLRGHCYRRVAAGSYLWVSFEDSDTELYWWEIEGPVRYARWEPATDEDQEENDD